MKIIPCQLKAFSSLHAVSYLHTEPILRTTSAVSHTPSRQRGRCCALRWVSINENQPAHNLHNCDSIEECFGFPKVRG